MINGMTLMLYVKNVRRAVNFWTAIGFEELLRVPLGESESVVLSNDDFGNVSLQLYELDYIRRNNPEIRTENPTLLFSVDEIDEAYELVKKETRRVSEISPLGEDYTFSFYDLDGYQYSVRGSRIDHGLTEEVVDLYFENLKNMQLINARDIEFLPDRSLIFFGRVTDSASRDFAGKLLTVRKGIYYVDTENKRLSPDLQIICNRYQITGDPVLMRRSETGEFVHYQENNDLESFLRA